MEEAWGGTFCIPDLSAFPGGLAYSLHEFVGLSLLLFFVLLIFFRRTFPSFFKLFYSSLLYRSDLEKIHKQSTYVLFRVVYLSFLAFLLLAALIYLRKIPFDPASSGWWYPLVVVVGACFSYFLFRWVVLGVMGWVTGERVLFADSTGILYPFYSLAVFWLLFSACFPTHTGLVLGGLMVVYLCYLGYLVKRFLLSKVSYFFTILYLCTLEFLVPAIWVGLCIKLI